MKNSMIKFIGLSFLTVLAAFGLANTAEAARPADLEVNIQGPSTANVNSAYIYTVNVKNVGGSDASNVRVSVEFPLTNTSPTVHILGKLTGINANKCSVVSRKLECNLNTIRKNRNSSFSFSFESPVSTKPLQIKATATTTSNETNLNNNNKTIAPTVGYAANQITSLSVTASHCTGQNLTSYFECELFPSSIQSFAMDLNLGGTISLQYPGYYGSWDQNISPQQLHFTVSDGSGVVLEFNGFASSQNCFEGITTFPQSPNYISPYKVCG